MSKNYDKRITITLSLPDFKEKNVINNYTFFQYKEISQSMPEKLIDFTLNKIKNLFSDSFTELTIKIEEIKLNKLNNRKIFIVSKIHYRKGSIYFDKLMSDIFKKLMELN